MLLQRKIVKILDNKDRKDGGYHPTREEYVSFLSENKSFYKNFRFGFYKSFRLNKKIKEYDLNISLGDCIRGPYNYIVYDPETQTKLLITTAGRNFIKKVGFCDEFLKRYPNIAVFIYGIIFVVVIKIIIYFLFGINL